MGTENSTTISQNAEKKWDEFKEAVEPVGAVVDKGLDETRSWLDLPGPIPTFLKKYAVDPETGELNIGTMIAGVGAALYGGAKFFSLTSGGDSTVDKVANPTGFVGKTLLAGGLLAVVFPVVAKWLGNVGADTGLETNSSSVEGNTEHNTANDVSGTNSIGLDVFPIEARKELETGLITGGDTPDHQPAPLIGDASAPTNGKEPAIRQ